MANHKNFVGLQFSGFEELIEKFDKLGGDIMKATEEAFKESQKAVVPDIEKAMQESNLPAEGEYSTGQTEKSIIRSSDVMWDGMTASIDIGFDMITPEGVSLTSVFLIYGTPKQAPVPGLYEAIYGKKTKNKIAAIQKEIFDKAIKERMER